MGLTSSYPLALANIGASKYYQGHRKYLKALIEALITYCDALEHTQIYRATRAYYTLLR
jgi:hypothetical protein